MSNKADAILEKESEIESSVKFNSKQLWAIIVMMGTIVTSVVGYGVLEKIKDIKENTNGIIEITKISVQHTEQLKAVSDINIKITKINDKIDQVLLLLASKK